MAASASLAPGNGGRRGWLSLVCLLLSAFSVCDVFNLPSHHLSGWREASAAAASQLVSFHGS